VSLKLVTIDMDETLLRNDKSYDNKRFDKIVSSLDKLGVIVCIASGNSVKEIKGYLSNGSLEIIYLAGDNGNDIELANNHISTNYIETNILKQVSELVDQDDDLQMIVNSPLNAYTKYIYEKDKDFISRFYDEIHIINSYEEIRDNEQPVKCAILSAKTLEKNKIIVKEINNEIEGVASVTAGEGWFDVYNDEGGKGAAVKWLQEEKNISSNQSIAFGDSLNDSGMMERSEFSVAMKNADKELKDICDYVIGSNEEQAVLDILEKFIKTGNMNFIEKYRN